VWKERDTWGDFRSMEYLNEMYRNAIILITLHSNDKRFINAFLKWNIDCYTFLGNNYKVRG
jgi:hypothetical protein